MSSRSLGSLTIDLIAKIAGFEQGMDKAARTADKRMKEIERSAKIAGAAIGGALVGGATLAANEIRKTINSMDDLSKAAQRANLPTEDFSKLAYAGDLADVAIQDLQSSLGRLAKAQADAQKETSQQARIFEGLGIATKDAEGNLRSTYDVFLDFADAFKRNQGSPEILAAGMNIFGRSFQTLIPLLKDGSQGLRDAGDEAEKLGLVLSTQAGKQAEEFNDNITRIQKSIRGMWMEVASQAIPKLTQLSADLAVASKNADLAGAAVSVLTTAFQAGVWVVEQYGNAVARTSIAIETMVKAAEGMREIQKNLGPGGLFNAGSISDGIRKVESAFADGQKQLDALIAKQNNPFRNVTTGGGGSALAGQGPDAGLAAMFGERQQGGSKGKSEAEKQAERLQAAYDGLMSRMHETIELFGKEGEAAKIRYEIEHGALKGISGPLAEQAIQRAEQIDQMRELDELHKAAKKAADDEVKRIQDGLAAGKDLLDDLEFELELMGKSNAERRTAIMLRGLDAEAVIKYGESIAKINQQIEDSFKNIRFMDGVRNEFSDFVTDVVTGASTIQDAFKGMLDNIARMITQRIADNWAEQLFGSFGSSAGGSTGGFWQSIIGGLFGGGKATGGWAQANTLYEVNERGLEMATVRGRDYLLTGNSPVHITPNHQLSSGGGVVNNFAFTAPASPKTQSQVAARVGYEIRRAQRLGA